MIGWRVIAVAVSLLMVLTGAGTASAADDGVHYDPDSPSGQEYALPLDQARGQGAPPTTEPEKFGQGVKPRASAASEAIQSPSASGGSSGSGGAGDAENVTPSGESRGDAAREASDDGEVSASRPEVDTASVRGPAALTGVVVAGLAVMAAAAATLMARRIRARS